MKLTESIIQLLPYKKPFLFVDSLELVTEDSVIGHYRIKEDEFYFKGHFPENPTVPGVIVTEIMAQIGLVCWGIFLHMGDKDLGLLPALTNSSVDFLNKVGPGDCLIVTSRKIFYRHGKLKCKISCKLSSGIRVAQGEFSGMIIKRSNS